MSSGSQPELVFGPVPSRRLGQSLGINTIPPKHCSYACVYCQLGRTPRMTISRQAFFDPSDVVDAVRRRLAECRQDELQVDYLTIVPDGEPTLDVNLGSLIEKLRSLGPPVAVITNSSLLDRADVRSELLQADWVSVKVDAVDEPTWRRVDRPHGALRLDSILDGVRRFAASFHGELVTENMLLHGLNDTDRHLDALADHLGEIAPAIAYLAAPIRPPAESGVRAPAAERLMCAYAAVASRVSRVEMLVGDPPPPAAFGSDLERHLLAITAVHPLDEDAVATLGGGREAVEIAARLVADGRLAVVSFRGRRFYLHAVPGSKHLPQGEAS